MFASSTIPILEQVVSFTEARHALLAGNIANLDTPGYRVRDLSLESFQEQLREAIEARARPQTQTEGAFGYQRVDPMEGVRESMRSILYHDESDVGLEQQVTEMSKNQFMHNLAIAIMKNQFHMFEVAVSERI
jgi:flagellar basal-body rod protein FlgB